MFTGSLTVVGTGIHLAGALTLAAKAWIEQAGKVLYAVADPATAVWLRTLNTTAAALPNVAGSAAHTPNLVYALYNAKYQAPALCQPMRRRNLRLHHRQHRSINQCKYNARCPFPVMCRG